MPTGKLGVLGVPVLRHVGFRSIPGVEFAPYQGQEVTRSANMAALPKPLIAMTSRLVMDQSVSPTPYLENVNGIRPRFQCLNQS